MRHSCLTVAVLGLVAVSFPFTAPAAAQTFEVLGVLPDVQLEIAGISSDGSTVVGSSMSEAFRWTADRGMESLGRLGGTYSHANAVSSDGSVVAGVVHIEPGTAGVRAFRWTEETGMVNLGALGLYSQGFGVSADGSTVVGQTMNAEFGIEPFRWTEEEGMVGLGNQGSEGTAASAASRDASVIVGSAAGPSNSGEAFRWTTRDGMGFLGTLGATGSSASDVSADGSVVVGLAGSPEGIRAFRWSAEEGMQGLGTLGGSWSQADDVSGDGSVVLGRSADATGAPALFIWTEPDGMRSLRHFIEVEHEIDITDWTIDKAWAGSAGGRVIVGLGTDPEGQRVIWRLELSMGLVVTESTDEPNAPLSLAEGICDVDRAEPGDQCTLRAAIEVVNEAPIAEDPIRIAFDIDSDTRRITLETSLPPVINSVIVGEPGMMVDLDGQGIVPVALQLVAPNSTVQGLAFDGFVDGVIIQGGGATVRSNVFGRSWLWTSTDASKGIENAAIHLLNVSGVRIGGADATPGSLVGNVIVNAGTGVLVENSRDVRIQGNVIGTVKLPIRGNGITAVDVNGLLIGGPRVVEDFTGGYRNDIEGARGHGIEISGDSDDLTIQGNRVEASGLDGIRIDLSAATDVLIGGDDEDLRNEVTFNHEWGVHLSGGADSDGPSGVVIAGNYTYSNGRGGMLLNQVGDVLLGGRSTEPGEAPGNSVSDGVVVRFAAGARIQGNRLYSQSGPDDMPGLSVGGPSNLIGGEHEGEGNTIFGFGTAEFADNRPVALLDEGSDTIIQGNTITGARTGVLLQGYRHRLVDNVISGNAGDGVRVFALGGERVEIQGNRIGVEADGMTADPNGAAGILVEAPNVHVGGEKSGETCEGPCNVIAGMQEDAGIRIAAEDVTVRGNMIGVGIDGSTPIPNAWGIAVNADDVSIGGWSGAEAGICDLDCNVISGNTLHGISSGNLTDGVDRLIVSGNYIGKALTGYAGNGLDGISIGGGTTTIIGALVGGADGTAGNVIAANGGTGVSGCGDHIHRLGPQQLTVRGNQIYGNGRMPAFDLSRECSGSGASDGITMNDPGDADDGPNGLLNSPTLVAARPADGGRSLLVLWSGDREGSPASYQVDIYADSRCRGYSTDGRLRVANRTFTFPLASSSDFDTLAITVPLELEGLRHYTATFTDSKGNTSEFGNCISTASDPEIVILTLSADVEVQAPGLLAKLSSASGKRGAGKRAASEVSLIASSAASSSEPGDFEGTIARAPGGSYVQPQSIVGSTWQLTPADPTPMAHDVCLELPDEDARDLVVVTRSPHTGGLWSPVDTYTRTTNGTPYACADDIPVFGQYALGSGSAAEAMPPQLFTPEAGITINSTTPDLAWDSVDGALRYDVQLSLDRAFASILRDTMGIEGTSWRVSDQLPTGATLYWRARAVLETGPTPWSSPFTFTTDLTAVLAENAGPLPEAFGLTSIYPNPSSGEAHIQFALPEPAYVAIDVYDVLGRRVGVVVEASLPAGRHEVVFNSPRLPSGLYLVRMRSGAFVETRTLTVVI